MKGMKHMEGFKPDPLTVSHFMDCNHIGNTSDHILNVSFVVILTVDTTGSYSCVHAQQLQLSFSCKFQQQRKKLLVQLLAIMPNG